MIIQNMHRVLYQSPAVTTDVAIFTIVGEQLKVLLVRRSDRPFRNTWALPGGFLHKNETTNLAAVRILSEKAGVKNVFVEQLYTFDAIGRDPRGRIMSVVYFTLVPHQDIKFKKGDKTQTPLFWSLKKLPKLAFDHKNIVTYARKRLASKLEYTNVVFSLLPKKFTFSQLQKAYEIILDRKLDKRNFRKKFLLLGLIKLTRGLLSGTRQRPARLYEFISRKPEELKKFF